MITNGEIFSKAYLEHLKAIDVAENIYKVAPNFYTKQKLEELQGRVFTVKERFTPEYIREYQKSKKDAKINSENEIKHLLNALHIEDLYADEKISFNKRVDLHEKNNQKFNLTYLV